MTTIAIPVDDDLAVIYKNLTDEQKDQFQTEVELVLQTLKPRNTSILDDIMRQMQAEAKSNGLTEEILNQLLADPSNE